MKIQVLALALIVAGTTAEFLNPLQQSRFLQETNATIPFSTTLGCGGCVRGGNIFCSKNGNTPICCQTATQCATQMADRTFTCSNSISSQFNRLVKICARNQPAGCGSKTNINLNSIGENQQINVTSIPVGTSCSYRVMSKCGFPAFEIDNANIDVSVINQAGGNENTVDDLADNATLSANEVAAPRVGPNGKIIYVSGNPDTKDATCGKMRKMFVTVTNLPVANSTNSTRILQAATSFAINFQATDGPIATSGAISMMMSASLAIIASLIFIAF